VAAFPPWTSRSLCFLIVALAAACGKRPAQAVHPDAGAPLAAAPGEPEPTPPPDAAPPRAATRLTLGEVHFASLGWDARAPRPDEAELRKRLDAAMAKAGLFPGGGEGALPAKLEFATGLGFQGDAGKETRVDAAVSLRLRWKEQGATRSMESRVLGQLPIAPGERKKLPERAQAALDRALGDAVAALAQRDGIRRGDEATVLAALSAADPDVRTEAFRAVGERHLSGALPRLTELLHSPDHEIRDAAIGAMVELGDRRAVKPLVDMVEFSDLDMMRRIIDAVGMLGGDEARDYLEFVASGHETPAVRALAVEALDRLKRRAAKAGTAPAQPR
jgi:HEAT repeats